MPTNPLQVDNPSTDASSLADSRPRQEPPESQRATLNSLPPLRLNDHERSSRATLSAGTSTRATKKLRFEGFAKDGCITCKGRYRRCDCSKPICDKCKADGKDCVWPQSTTSQQPEREDNCTNNLDIGSEDSRAPTLRPSRTNATGRADSDLMPAFAYDASRRPSQRLVRLNHSADRVRRFAKSWQVALRSFLANNS